MLCKIMEIAVTTVNQAFNLSIFSIFQSINQSFNLSIFWK